MIKYLLLTFFCFTCFLATAQTPDAYAVSSFPFLPSSLRVKAIPDEAGETVPFRKNNVKINLSSLVLDNYSFFYERSLSRKISFVAGYRFMPASTVGELPGVQKLSERYLEDEEDIRDDLNNLSTSNNTFTGEFRFYGGKKPGARGLYLSLYGRYTDMQIDYSYDYETNNNAYLIPLKSDLKGFGGGLMIGSQWLIAKRVVLDWYILGGHYGKLTGNADAAVDLSSMTAAEKAELQQDLESLLEVQDISYISEVSVTDEGVKAKVDGPFLGIRGAGINLGIAF